MMVTSTRDAVPQTPSAKVRRVLVPAYSLFALMTVVIGITVTVATRLNNASAGRGRSWITSWFQFDGVWYNDIAAHGYSYTPGQMSTVAFFPSYPVAVHGMEYLTGSYPWAASIVTLLCSIIFITAFSFWVINKVSEPVAVTAIALVMLYPYSLFLYGSMYSDSLFIMVSFTALILADRKHYWLAGLVAIVATAGRPVGVAVTVGITAMALQHIVIARRELTITPDVDRKHPIRFMEMIRAIRYVTWRECGVLVSLVGLIGWMIYLGATFSSPLAFLETQSAPGWYQGSGPKTWFKVVYIGHLLFGRFPTFLLVTAQAVMCLLAILLMRRALRLLGWGYAAYGVVVLAIPIIGTKDFMGTGRYVLACFPVFVAAAHYLVTKHPRWRYVIYPVFVLGMITATSLFAFDILVS